jgi:hypothetical protein
LRYHLLLARLTVDAKLLALGHAALYRPIVADLLPLDRAVLRLSVGAHLLPLGSPSLPLHLLLPLGSTSLRALDALRTRLVTLGDASPLDALSTFRPRLTTLGSLDALDTLRALGPLRMLHSRRLERLALRPRDVAAAPASARRLSPLATAALLGDRRLAILTPAAVGPRTCRGCDRKRCNARCEKHPGHQKISFRTAKTARSPHRSNA